MRVLVIDIGGNNVKVAIPGRSETVKVPSGPDLTAERMVTGVRTATAGWKYDVVSVGYPGPVANGAPSEEPVNLGDGWVGFNFEAAFGKPVRFINDAAMQALGSYEGGRMLFLGLGTGLGSALVVDGVVVPLELAHLPFRKGRSYEQMVGRAGLDRYGKRRWRTCVAEVTSLLKHALQADYVMLGGGNVRALRDVPPGARVGGNANAMLGGVRLWEAPAWAAAAVHAVKPSRPGRAPASPPRAARSAPPARPAGARRPAVTGSAGRARRRS